MERHPAIGQWLTERRRELARNRIAQSMRRRAQAAEARKAPRPAAAPGAGRPRTSGVS
jgi:hypothetical protein